MVSGKTICIAAILAGATTISAASAQSFGGPFTVEGQVYQRAIPISPVAVFDALVRAGYREFGPMAPREPIYTLKAVNARGDLVALQISMFTGEILREVILALGQRAPLRVYSTLPQPQVSAAPPPPPAPAAPPPAGGRDPLVVY